MPKIRKTNVWMPKIRKSNLSSVYRLLMIRWKWHIQRTIGETIAHLESADVIVIAVCGAEVLKRLDAGAPGHEGDAEVDERAHPIRPQQAEVPRHDGSPVVAHNEHLHPRDPNTCGEFSTSFGGELDSTGNGAARGYLR